MSHSAISSAASDFMRRSSCIDIGFARLPPTTSRQAFSISRARCGSGSHSSSRISAARHRRAPDRKDRARLPRCRRRMVLASGSVDQSSIAPPARLRSSASRQTLPASRRRRCGPSTNRAASAVDLTFASVFPRIVIAGKSKAAPNRFLASVAWSSDIRRRARAIARGIDTIVRTGTSGRPRRGQRMKFMPPSVAHPVFEPQACR